MNDQTILTAIKIAQSLDVDCKPAKPAPAKPIPVVVCTDKRGVVFGYTDDPSADPIALTNARMCLSWSADVGGVFGLADIGPTKDCRVSAEVQSLSLAGITCVMESSEHATTAWTRASVQGRK